MDLELSRWFVAALVVAWLLLVIGLIFGVSSLTARRQRRRERRLLNDTREE